MTGRDVPTREKALSVILSAIMVLSVVAIGGAAFTGNVAASDPVDTGGEGVFVSSTANSGENGVDEHIIRLNLTGTDVADSTLTGAGAQIQVDYDADDINLSSGNFGDVASGGQSGNDIQGHPAIKIFVAGSELETDGTDYDVVSSVSEGSITLDLENADNNNDLSTADIITIRLADENANGVDTSLDNPSSGNATVSIDDGTDSADFNVPIDLDEDAPVHATIGGNDEFYHTIEYAVGDATTGAGTEDIVEVQEDLTVADDPDGRVFSGVSLGASNVTITSADDADPEVRIDESTTGTSVDPYIDLNNEDEITVSNLVFNLTGGSITAISETGAGAINATVTGNTFENFDSTTLNIRPQSGGDDNVDTLSISENTFTSDSSGAIQVDVQDLDDSDGVDTVEIADNTLDITTGPGIFVDAGGANDFGKVDLRENNIDGNENDVIGIRIASGNDITADFDITGGLIDGVNTGVDTSTGDQAIGDFLNVTDLEAVNVSDHDGANSVVLDLTGSPGATITVDGLTVNSSSDATAVDVADSGSDLTVTGSSIKDTNNGIVVSDVSGTAVVSNTTVDNSAGTAIDLDGPDAGGAVDVAVNESTSIDQATTGIDVDISNTAGSTVDVNNVDVNGTSSGVDITGLTDDSTTFVNVTDSTFTNNDGAGLNLSDPGVTIADTGLNVHFNTFEDNDAGVGVDDGENDFNGVLNVTFNDFVSNTNAGLDVVSVNNGQVNANYSWWGSDAGPNSAGGDSVTDPNDDATIEPFLLESAVDNYDDSNLGGTNVLRFGHNVEVTNNKGAVSFPTTANRTAGASIEGDTSNVMVYKLVDGQFIDAGDQVPDTMEGHVIDLTESSRTSAWVTISYSDDVQDGLGGVTYEQGQNLVGPPTQGAANAGTVFGLSGDYVISPFLSNTDDKFEPNTPLDRSKSGTVSDDVSPFDAYIIEVPDADDDLVDRFRGGNVPGGTDASEVEALLTN